MDNPTPGQAAFEAYSDYTSGLTYDGQPIPPWNMLNDTVKGAWEAAAKFVLDNFSAPPVDPVPPTQDSV